MKNSLLDPVKWAQTKKEREQWVSLTTQQRTAHRRRVREEREDAAAELNRTIPKKSKPTVFERRQEVRAHRARLAELQNEARENQTKDTLGKVRTRFGVFANLHKNEADCLKQEAKKRPSERPFHPAQRVGDRPTTVIRQYRRLMRGICGAVTWKQARRVGHAKN